MIIKSLFKLFNIFLFLSISISGSSQQLIWESTDKTSVTFYPVNENVSYLVVVGGESPKNINYNLLKLDGAGKILSNKSVQSKVPFKNSPSDWVMTANTAVKIDSYAKGLFGAVIEGMYVTVVTEDEIKQYDFPTELFGDVLYYITTDEFLYIVSGKESAKEVSSNYLYEQHHLLSRIDLKTGKLKKFDLEFPAPQISVSSFWVPLNVMNGKLQFYRLFREEGNIGYDFIQIDSEGGITNNAKIKLPFKLSFPKRTESGCRYMRSDNLSFRAIDFRVRPEYFYQRNIFQRKLTGDVNQATNATIATLYYVQELNCYISYGCVGDAGKREDLIHGLFYLILDDQFNLIRFVELPKVKNMITGFVNHVPYNVNINRDLSVQLSFEGKGEKKYIAQSDGKNSPVFVPGENPVEHVPFNLESFLMYDVEKFKKICNTLEPGKVKYDKWRYKTYGASYVTQNGTYYFKSDDLRVKIYFDPN